MVVFFLVVACVVEGVSSLSLFPTFYPSSPLLSSSPTYLSLLLWIHTVSVRPRRVACSPFLLLSCLSRIVHYYVDYVRVCTSSSCADYDDNDDTDMTGWPPTHGHA